MIIEISPNKIIPNAVTVWNQHNPDVDVTMDLKNLSFKPGTINTIFYFTVLDHLFEEESIQAIKNWRECLKPGGQLYVIVDDFDYICRSYISGDFPIQDFNMKFSHPLYFSKDSLTQVLESTGFKGGNLKIWYAEIEKCYMKKDYE